MSNIGYVSNISNLVTLVKQVTVNDVKTDKSAAIAKVNFVVNGWSTDIHANIFIFGVYAGKVAKFTTE
jgi:hypothetical protein